MHGKEFVKVVNAKDMARITDGVIQVVKFHGDFDDDLSIVITETDYFDRLSFESPLDIKLRSDSFGRPILFIGYSMSDLNIRFLLHRLWKTWQASGFERDRPQSWVFMIESNPIETAVLEQWAFRSSPMGVLIGSKPLRGSLLRSLSPFPFRPQGRVLPASRRPSPRLPGPSEQWCMEGFGTRRSRTSMLDMLISTRDWRRSLSHCNRRGSGRDSSHCRIS